MRNACAVPRPCDIMVFLQSHGPLLPPALADLLDAPRADPLDFFEEGGAFVNHVESACAEHLDDLAGVMRADALDQAGAEILFDAFDGARGQDAQRVGLELPSELRIVHPLPGRLDELAGSSARRLPDDYHATALPAHLDAQHDK